MKINAEPADKRGFFKVHYPELRVDEILEAMTDRLPWIPNDVVTEFDEVCGYHILDGPTTALLHEQLYEAYLETKPVIERVLGKSLLYSPWPRSAINVNRMTQPGGTLGKHCDSNPITVLLALTDGSPTVFYDDEDTDSIVKVAEPRAGYGWVFDGKKYPHRVSVRVSQTGLRYTLPLLYYTPTDCSRPPYQDDYVYGNVNYNELGK